MFCKKINTVAFKNPQELMTNIQLVVDHITAAMARSKVDCDRRTLEFVCSKQGSYIYHDDNNQYWRSYVFIDDARAYDSIENSQHFYEAGRGFGEFQKYLFDFPADKLTATIPDFHNTTKRFYAFVAAVAEDKAGRVSSLEKEIDFFFDRRKMMNKILALTEAGVLPERVTHNDTKLNNVLIDNATGKALCVIDLDNEECANAVDMDNFYRVPADNRGLNYDKYFKDGDVERNPLSEFNSNNTELLNVEQVKEKLLSLEYIKKELENEGKQ